MRVADLTGVPARPRTVCLRRRRRQDGTEEIPYEPEVLDLSKVSTPVELLAMAEMMAEEAHDRWASQLKNTSGMVTAGSVWFTLEHRVETLRSCRACALNDRCG